MAVAVYTSDLADIFIDGTTTGWSALGGGASGLNQETDYFIQGTSCLSKNAFANSTRGMIYVDVSRTIPTDGAMYMWLTHQTANSLDLRVNGGLQVLVGSSSGDYRHYYIAGSDTIIYDDRWVCIPIDPAVATADLTTGTPTAVYSCFGTLATMVGGPTKGAPLAVDAIRFGKNYTYTEGQIGDYASFDGAALFNDNVARRYGFIQLANQTYKMQGTHNLGSVATFVDFRDSDRTLVIADTIKTSSNFNKINIVNTASIVEMTNIQISALGTNARGNFECIDSATVTLIGCTFSQMGTFIFNAATNTNIVRNCTFRRCDTVTSNGSTITNTLFELSRNVSVVVANLSEITNCNFIGTGTQHAVNLGTITTTTSMTWDNNFETTVYSVLSEGPNAVPVGGENHVIRVSVASGQTLTINVAAGATSPTVFNTGAGAVAIVAGQVTLTLTDLIINTEVRVYTAGTLTELAGVEDSGTTFGYTYTFAPSTFVDIVIHNIDYQYIKLLNVELGASNASLPIQQRFDRNYTNP